MTKNENNHSDRRDFQRVGFSAPIRYKIISKDTISKLLNGYTSNVSQSGILCVLSEAIELNNILWLNFDRGVLTFCSELEKRCFIYQHGIIGKVVRVEPKEQGTFEIGIRFLTREEKENHGQILTNLSFS